jgi:hypothetical protein
MHPRCVSWALTLLVAASRATAAQEVPTVVGPATAAYELQTDLTRYQARATERIYDSPVYAFKVVALFRNRSSRAVFLSTCRPDALQPKYDVVLAKGPSAHESFAAYSLAWAGVGHDRQLEVRPGATRIDTLTLHGPTSWDGRTKQPLGAVEGSFHLVFGVHNCRGTSQCEVSVVPISSNEFRVTIVR